MLGPQAEAEKPPMKTAMEASATADASFSGSFTSHIIGGVLVMTTRPARGRCRSVQQGVIDTVHQPRRHLCWRGLGYCAAPEGHAGTSL